MRMKSLNRLHIGGTSKRMTVGVPLPKTPEGRVYRYSPNEEAHPRHFVLGGRPRAVEADERKRSRMKHEPGTPGTVCPYSGTIAADEAFTHPDDVKAAGKIVLAAAMADTTAAFEELFSDIARKSKGSIKYTRANRPKPRPRFGRRDLMRLLVCDHCGRDYGVFAIGLFCPDCGAPNIALHFTREVDLVAQQVDIAEGLEKERQELAYRLLGNAHEDVLTAFEATLKTIYHHVVPTGKPVGNDFQNVEKGQKRFAEVGIDPFSALTGKELERLKLNIQKRHVVGHNLGVVDAKFAKTAAEAKLGETVKLLGDDINEFARLSQKVVIWLDEWLGGQALPAATPDASDAEPSPTPSSHVEGLGPLATRIGSWICQSSTNGLPGLVSDQALRDAFPDQGPAELSEAIAELEAEGFVTCHHAIGLKVPHVSSTDELFLTFDPVVLQADPVADAIALCQLVLDGREAVESKKLHGESGLPLRRFNPAVSLIVAEVGDGRISRAIGELDYPTRYFFLIAEDRVAIRRLLKQLQG